MNQGADYTEDCRVEIFSFIKGNEKFHPGMKIKKKIQLGNNK